MAAIASAASKKIHGLLTGGAGLGYTVAAVAAREGVPLAPITADRVITEPIAADLAERTAGAVYPAVHVYCVSVTNLLREKFRTFSGKASMVIEARTTHDRLEGVTREVELYAAAAVEVLDAHRGDWSEGMFYTGGYKIEYGPVRRGGRGFLQAAKITFEVDVSL